MALRDHSLDDKIITAARKNFWKKSIRVHRFVKLPRKQERLSVQFRRATNQKTSCLYACSRRLLTELTSCLKAPKQSIIRGRALIF